jgi:hypothetical protein
LGRAVVALETERINGSNSWCLWWNGIVQSPILDVWNEKEPIKGSNPWCLRWDATDQRVQFWCLWWNGTDQRVQSLVFTMRRNGSKDTILDDYDEM